MAFNAVNYQIEILLYSSGSLTKIAEVKNPMQLSAAGNILVFTKELSDFGQCQFRVSAYDQMLKQYGDIFQPHQYHVRIRRNGQEVWHGAIIDNKKRTKEYIDVICAEYEWYLSKVLLNRSSLNPVLTGPTQAVTSFSMSGTNATIGFSGFPAGSAPLVNGSVALTGFTPSQLNVSPAQIFAISGNQIQVSMGLGPYSASKKGSVIFSDGIYRIFYTGFMSDAVTKVIQETIANIGTQGVLGGMTVGTIQNPNYPPNTTDANGNALTGAWNFVPTTFQLQFDYQNVLKVMQMFGTYTFADFYIDNNLVFNFLNFQGRDKQNSCQFTFTQASGQAQNNIIDYNLPRLGQQTVNSLSGIATDDNGNVLHVQQSDQASIDTNGLLEGVAAYADISNTGLLSARIAAELPLVSEPTTLAATVVLNETTSLPLGVWDVGDIVGINIKNNGVSFNAPMRIVGASCAVHSTGREFTTVQTNTPLPWQFPLAMANGT